MTLRKSGLLLLILLGSCAPMAEIDIRVMDPADITLPLNVQQLAFMNRSAYPALVLGDSMGWTAEEFYILDTIMGNRIFMGVRESMSESPLYELESIRVIQNRRSDTIGLLKPLSSDELKRLKIAHEGDALISLEFYHIKDSLDSELYYFDEEGSYYESYMGFKMASLWRIYDLTRDTVFDEYVLRDSTSWYSYGGSVNQSLNGLPRVVDALREAAYNLGWKYGQRISPTWLEEPRFYFRSGNKGMRQAARKAGGGDWNGAAETWKEIAYQENERAAAKACFNMALMCELEDLLIPALDWAVKSYSIRQKPLTKEYIELLQKRYSDRKRLRSQVPLYDSE